MLSSTGKAIRLGRILDPEIGRGIVVAYSHSLILGPQKGTRTSEDIRSVLEACRSANSIMVTPGMADRFAGNFAGRGRPSMMIHLDWTNFSRRTLPHSQGAQVDVASIEHVAACGADAVMTYLLVGFDDPEREAAEIRRNARIARECDRLGIVLMIEPRYAQEQVHPELKLDPEVMQMYCRMSADLGADLVKCVWPGSVEAMAAISESCHAPVLVAGGARDDSQPDRVFELAEAAVQGGARGLVFGRSVYQSPDPRATLKRLESILASAPLVGR